MTAPSADLGDPAEEWPVHASETIWEGGAPFSFRKETISAPGKPGETFDRVLLDHPGAVVVLALDADERVFVLHQYRHPVRRRMLELPAGLLDEPGGDPEAAARRELREESLLEAATWTHLLTTYSSPGISSERIEIYAATDLTEVDDRGDFTPEHEEAEMSSSWVPFDDLLEAFLDRRITDGPTGHALTAWALRHRR